MAFSFPYKVIEVMKVNTLRFPSWLTRVICYEVDLVENNTVFVDRGMEAAESLCWGIPYPGRVDSEKTVILGREPLGSVEVECRISREEGTRESSGVSRTNLVKTTFFFGKRKERGTEERTVPNRVC